MTINYGTYNLTGKKLGESSLFLMISLHLLIVSNNKEASPTLNKVAKQRPISFLVGGPGDSLICLISCSTNFFWHPLISDYKKIIFYNLQAHSCTITYNSRLKSFSILNKVIKYTLKSS